MNRFSELARRANAQSRWTETGFLTMAEQDILLAMRLDAPYALYGGYEGAERRIACFGSEEAAGYPYAPPIACVKAAPAHGKFAKELAHRDVLGALMGLGIERRTTGDILFEDNTAYIFCLEEMAQYIVENLTSAGRTALKRSISDPPKTSVGDAEPLSFTIASERLDALVAAVYRMGRSAAKELVVTGRVYINSRLVQNPDAAVSAGSMVSVRGHGRFKYLGTNRTTKKGRLSVEVEKY